ncbi:unnamed protein product, partial [Allacma fusca]
MHQEICQNFGECPTQYIIYEKTRQNKKDELEQPFEFDFNTFSPLVGIVHLLLSPIKKNNSVTINKPIVSSRFHSICSVVILPSEFVLQFNAEEVITWSDNLLPHNSFLGLSFFIFASQPENLQLLTTLSPVVQRKVFLILKDNQVLLQKQYPGITNELITSAIFNPTTRKLQMLKETIFSKNFEDLEGTTVPVLVCPMCNSAYDDFVKEGYWWSHNIGSVYETLIRLNASVVLEGTFGVPRIQMEKEGEEVEFDEYTVPLIDGSAPISTLVVANLPAEKTKHLSFFAVTAVVRPFLDQGVNVTKNFNRLWNLSMMKFIYGIWLLNAIVLGCCYKSTLISAIVSPRYVLPPRTFSELFRSQYNVGAVLFQGVIEYDIKAINNSGIPDFLRRVTEYEYTSGDCYRKIFGGNVVCLTYSFLMETFGIENMIDIYGRRIYWQSKDSLSHRLLVNGVSKFYPMLLEPLNRILSRSENSGLFSLYRNVARAKREKKGRQNAKKWIADEKFYLGVQDIETTGTRQFGA